ncbi:MAG: hypothetical protein ACRBBQ_15870 [Cognatishimia sp.]
MIAGQHGVAQSISFQLPRKVQIDEEKEFVEAVAAWRNAGKPRFNKGAK